jgi:hypothetical protein
MKNRFLTGLVFVTCFAGLCADEPKSSSVNNAKKTVATAKAKPVLAKGMTCDEVVRLLGQPAQIKAHEGKSESWTYRRLLRERMDSKDTGAMAELASYSFDGAGPGMVGTRDVRVSTLIHVQIYEVTTLLIVDNRLVVARQWQEKQTNYDE